MIKLFYIVVYSYLVSYFIIWSHYRIIKVSTGSFQKRQMEEIQKSIYLMGFGNNIFKGLNPVTIYEYLKYIFAQYKILYFGWLIKSDMEYKIWVIQDFKSKPDYFDKAYWMNIPIDSVFYEKVEQVLLSSESMLLHLRKTLGYNSKYIEDLSLQRLEEIKNYDIRERQNN